MASAGVDNRRSTGQGSAGRGQRSRWYASCCSPGVRVPRPDDTSWWDVILIPRPQKIDVFHHDLPDARDLLKKGAHLFCILAITQDPRGTDFPSCTNLYAPQTGRLVGPSAPKPPCL